MGDAERNAFVDETVMPTYNDLLSRVAKLEIACKKPLEALAAAEKRAEDQASLDAAKAADAIAKKADDDADRNAKNRLKSKMDKQDKFRGAPAEGKKAKGK